MPLFHWVLWAAVAGALAMPCASRAKPSERCPDLMPGRAFARMRALTARDLARLRDIGPASGETGSHLFAISPDGQRLAFQIRQGDPDTNSYCLAMVVVDLAGKAASRLVDQGGEFIRIRADQLGRAGIPSGMAQTITPVWSRHGDWIAFLKQDGPVVQIWRARADGSMSEPLSHSEVDVEAFELADDDSTIRFVTRPAMTLAMAAIAREGLAGFRYDDRFSPTARNSPFVRAPLATTKFELDLVTRQVRPMEQGDSRADAQADAPLNDPARSHPKPLLAALTIATDGRRAWTEPVGPDLLAPVRLHADTLSGRPIACLDKACIAARFDIWWSDDHRRVRFLRYEGVGDSLTAIYEWAPGLAAPRRLYATEDQLLDCQPVARALICGQEEARRPRRLIRFSADFRSKTVLFDPNPEFDHFRLGAVERIKWVNSFGIATFGDIVFPVDYRSGSRYPLIVVQYGSRGFLRGGTGDEAPIQAFANRGYLVLSIQRPSQRALAQGARTPADADARILKDFADRRSVLSSIELAVQHLLLRGIVDPDRIGITGLSDGSSTVQFAAVNSHMFAAGSVSGCCWEQTQGVGLGPAVAAHFAKTGWPGLTIKAQAFWSSISLTQNSDRIAFPLLMQMADDEYLMALESFTALRDAGRPVDMFVYPGEHHIKWQPAHRLAVYERNLAWFDYWLKAMLPNDPRLNEDARAWIRMRQIDKQRRGPSPHAPN